jgi:hypothetical protein
MSLQITSMDITSIDFTDGDQGEYSVYAEDLEYSYPSEYSPEMDVDDYFSLALKYLSEEVLTVECVDYAKRDLAHTREI